jgi:hypothetical protein
VTTLEPTAKDLLRWQRQMRADFYRRQGEQPPEHEQLSVEIVDTSPKAPVEPPKGKAT